MNQLCNVPCIYIASYSIGRHYFKASLKTRLCVYSRFANRTVSYARFSCHETSFSKAALELDLSSTSLWNVVGFNKMAVALSYGSFVGLNQVHVANILNAAEHPAKMEQATHTPPLVQDHK